MGRGLLLIGIAMGVIHLFPALSSATVIKCTAQVTIHAFTVTLDTESLLMNVTSDNGHRYRGQTSYYYSPKTKDPIYFLPTGFGSGLELELETGGQERIAFCTEPNRCYLCRR